MALHARLLPGARHRKLALVDQRHTDEIQPLSPTIDLPVSVRGGPPAPLTSELLAFLMA
ncbi:hypothetical protein [Streptomyces sp. NPDC046832]|uniref:hypothetical protein n=1 Tax=Streptomyces sp. NPDC046832 TaxID=3155020 RepID=UPI0033EED160